jgi:hypothetical protein
VLGDAGNGTVVMPPPCPDGYRGQLIILNGVVGGHIDVDAQLTDLTNLIEVPGGILGGTTSTFDGTLYMTMNGNGGLAGYHRNIAVPVSGSAIWGPRTPGDAVQDFDAEINIAGDIFGDPDFDFLHFRAGTDFGMTSPGHTTLTRLGPPGSDFQIDSFFDVDYTIEFQGAPGSVLEGMGGTTRAIAPMTICEGAVSNRDASWGQVKTLYR